MPRLISCLSLLIPRTTTSTRSPICTSSLGWLIAPGPGHLGDVDQALDAFFELHERPVAHDVDHLAGDAAADGVLLSMFPTGWGLLLQAQGDLLLVVVDVQDLTSIPRRSPPSRRVVDPAPAHVGDVQQPVDPAEVDERAEVGDVLDHALAEFAWPIPRGSRAVGPSSRPALLDQRRRLTTMLRRSSSIFSTMRGSSGRCSRRCRPGGGCRPGWPAGTPARRCPPAARP